MTNYISNLRNIATFSVIFVHAAAIYVLNFQNISLESWRIANFLDSFVRFCVPAFLMISGALLLNKEEDFTVFINKRLKRVLIPFIFWNIIYFIYKNYKLELSAIDLLQEFVLSFIRGSSFHFWYIYLIIGLYLFIPILRKWTISAPEKEVRYFLIIWGITLFINEYTTQFFPKIELMYFSKFLGYLVLGHYLHKFVDYNKFKLLGISLFSIGVLATFFLTDYFTVKNDQFFPFFYEYLSPNIVLASIGIFILVKNLNIKTNKYLLKLDSYSYGIYLVHIIVLNVIKKFLLKIEMDVLTSIFLLSILTYLFSFITIYLLVKIKYIKNIVT